jgi:hypothetical protein
MAEELPDEEVAVLRQREWDGCLTLKGPQATAAATRSISLFPRLQDDYSSEQVLVFRRGVSVFCLNLVSVCDISENDLLSTVGTIQFPRK